MTADASGLTGTTPTVTIATTQEASRLVLRAARRRPQDRAEHGDLRGKVLRITVKAGDISTSEANSVGGAYTVPNGNLFPRDGQDASGDLRYGLPEPVPDHPRQGRRRVRDRLLARLAGPQIFRGPQGIGRVEIVRGPANYGWPLCVKTDLPYYKWDFNTSTPLPSAAAPEPHECDNPARGPQNTSRWVASGGPAVDPGLEYGPPITQPEIWYSYRDNQAPPNGPQGTPCFAQYGPGAPPNPVGRVSAAVPGGVHWRRRPARSGAVQLRPRQPEHDEVPAVLRRRVHPRRVHSGHHA